MRQRWQMVILVGSVVFLCACAKSKEQLVHTETMVIKNEKGEKKQEVRDPTEAGVQSDAPNIRYTPE